LADEGQHHFTYALHPHGTHWTQSYLALNAFQMNSPLIAVPVGQSASDGTGFVEIEEWEPELGLGTLKTAFDGDGLILRIYEPYGRRGPVRLRFDQPATSIERVNLLEEPVDGDPLELIDGGSALKFDVRPFEIVTLRIRM
jgi:alpha-mannosidase